MIYHTGPGEEGIACPKDHRKPPKAQSLVTTGHKRKRADQGPLGKGLY